MAEQTTTEGQPSTYSDRELYTIPSRSSWFTWDEIHDTEKIELGEFFDGSSFSRNPRVYKEYRDFIINKFREDSSRRLTFTDVRRSLAGDVGSIHRVFLFLDRWGLINFSPSDSDRATGAADSGEIGGFSVSVEDAPPSTVRVVPNPNSSAGLAIPAASSGSKLEDSGSSFKFPPLTSYKDVFSQRIPLSNRVCADCGEESASGYYESKSGITICRKCFETAKADQRNAIEDYKFRESQIAAPNQWTDREMLSLLEALVSKGPDWDLIANHVRRNQLDCIAKLVQLPFSGLMAPKFGKLNQTPPPTRENGESMKENLPDYGNNDITPKKRKHVPSFADAGDSLLDQMASLSTIAGADVASAAADVAISALGEESSYAKRVFKSGDHETKVEDGETEESSGGDTWRNFSRSIFQIRAAVATALAAAAARAKLLADQEERQIEFLVAYIIDLQIKKMGHKMKHFEELESIMEQEYADIQRIKEEIIKEWINVSRQSLSAGIPRWKDRSLTKSSSLIL